MRRSKRKSAVSSRTALTRSECGAFKVQVSCIGLWSSTNVSKKPVTCRSVLGRNERVQLNLYKHLYFNPQKLHGEECRSLQCLYGLFL